VLAQLTRSRSKLLARVIRTEHFSSATSENRPHVRRVVDRSPAASFSPGGALRSRRRRTARPVSGGIRSQERFFVISPPGPRARTRLHSRARLDDQSTPSSSIPGQRPRRVPAGLPTVDVAVGRASPSDTIHAGPGARFRAHVNVHAPRVPGATTLQRHLSIATIDDDPHGPIPPSPSSVRAKRSRGSASGAAWSRSGWFRPRIIRRRRIARPADCRHGALATARARAEPEQVKREISMPRPPPLPAVMPPPYGGRLPGRCSALSGVRHRRRHEIPPSL
jgi:hypothetical protein